MRLATITNWAYGSTVGLTLASAVTMLLASNAQENERAAVTQRYLLDKASSSVAESVTTLSDLAQNYVVTNNPARLADYRRELSTVRSVEDRTSALRDNGAGPEELSAIAAAMHRADELQDEQRAAIDALAKSDADGARRILFGPDYDRELELIDADVDRFQFLLDQRANFNLTAAVKLSRIWKACSEVVLALTGALFLGVLYFVFKQRVLRRVVKLSDVVNRLAAQDFAVEPPDYEDIDEIGDLSQALRIFKTNGLERQRLERERTSELALRSLLSRMTQRMQECETLRQLQQVIETFIPAIAPAYAGRLYLFDGQRNAVIEAGAWQGNVRSAESFSATSCWALHRQEIHRPNGDSADVPCEHIAHALGRVDSICMPLMAQHATLGLLYLERDPSSTDEQAPGEANLKLLTESVSLSLGNLQLREELKHLSLADPLTGLANRRHLDTALPQRVDDARQSHQRLTCLMLDLDHFKGINDSFGHQTGDAVLRQIGALLRQTTRESDFAARYGGEEFIVLMADLTLQDALQRANDLRQRIRRLRIESNGHEVENLTVSIGIATAPDQCSYETLVQSADAVLFRAKAAGRDRVESAERRRPQEPLADPESSWPQSA